MASSDSFDLHHIFGSSTLSNSKHLFHNLFIQYAIKVLIVSFIILLHLGKAIVKCPLLYHHLWNTHPPSLSSPERILIFD